MIYYNSDNEKKEAVKAYVFAEYRDKAGVGDFHVYTSAQEALEAAQSYWNTLCKSDKESYLKDACACFFVAECFAVENDGTLETASNEDGSAADYGNVLWDALEEERANG